MTNASTFALAVLLGTAGMAGLILVSIFWPERWRRRRVVKRQRVPDVVHLTARRDRRRAELNQTVAKIQEERKREAI